MLKLKILEKGKTVTSWTDKSLGETAWPKETEHLKVDGRDYLYMPATAGQFPPGLWQVVSGMPALQQNQYVSMAASLGDSTDTEITYTTLCASVHTTDPNTWYVSQPDSSYSVDNIFPGVPTGFMMDYHYDGTGNDLDWDASEDEDFQYFKVYRGLTPDFVIDSANPFHQTIDHQWTDMSGGAGYFYKVASVDDAGNESEATLPDTVSDVPQATFDRYALQAAVPNPFNPATKIEYRVPRGGGDVRLSIYDLQGRRVKMLVSGLKHEGVYAVMWKGRDQRNRQMPTGVYFCRLQAPGFSQTQKLTLMK